MSLREQAAADARAILEDDSGCGMGWPVEVIDPSGKRRPMLGFSNDISQVIDPETGVAVSGRLATVVLSQISFLEEFGALPVSVASTSRKPWRVEWLDLAGALHSFKVSESNPDRTLGRVNCILEVYAP